VITSVIGAVKTDVFTAPLSATRHFGFPIGAAVVRDGDGARVLYTDARSRKIDVFEARSSDGGDWSEPKAFAASAVATSAAASLAVDPQGNLHALWFDARTGGWLPYAARAQASGDFGTAERVGEAEALESKDGSTPPLEAAIAVGGGRRCAVWTDPRGGVFFASAPAQ
jgi:hypothetical protein